MPTTERAIYRSSNGDQWYLVEEPGSERIFVRHQPNRASGGQSSLVEVADFLSEGHGPSTRRCSVYLEMYKWIGLSSFIPTTATTQK